MERLNIAVAIFLVACGAGGYLLTDHSVRTNDDWFEQAVLKNERPVIVVGRTGGLTVSVDGCGTSAELKLGFRQHTVRDHQYR
ncbi:MAG: hypothetical protein R3C49_07390 [Planctomycetaceae bacterium]